MSKALAELKQVVAIVLYGSHARGEAGRKSDIDLLIVVDKRTSELESEINDIIEREETGWRVVQTVLTTQELTKDPYYAFDILRDGIVLYKRPNLIELPFALRERAVTAFTFDMSKLPQKDRARLDKALYGCVYKKKLKGGKRVEYRYIGVLEGVGGKRLGKGSLLVPAKAEGKIEAVLREHKVRFDKKHLILVEEEKS